ncbi:hypothetical protein [Solimonas sp. SE-A11]|uniref:hypothetical protein n=1 Tax=Solimonas sp. SE-A11 TaxID=3054954 RepID=UPI00259CF2AF|nr:hypothetical protein [Solimonas sp. SE-A11]MDM4773011.1 hypothetical protein [Solimonas sp. SE-A11]
MPEGVKHARQLFCDPSKGSLEFLSLRECEAMRLSDAHGTECPVGRSVAREIKQSRQSLPSNFDKKPYRPSMNWQDESLTLFLRILEHYTKVPGEANSRRPIHNERLAAQQENASIFVTNYLGAYRRIRILFFDLNAAIQ